MNGYIQCWEYFRCGRNPGGLKACAEGVCPASSEYRVNGVNHGVNGGRCCWAVAGSFSKSEHRCQIRGHVRNCVSCDFFWLVQEQTGGFGAKVLEIRALLDDSTAYSKIRKAH